MTDDLPVRGSRVAGTVARIGAEYGFIATEEAEGDNVYFRTSWYRGTSRLQVGDSVEFDLKYVDDKPQARRLCVAGENYDEDNVLTGPERREPSCSAFLLHWAYMGYMPSTLSDLAAIALPERWEFLNTAADPEKPHPILSSYLLNTFGRLAMEHKVLVSQDRTIAAFNTGLVDTRYEQVHAIFEPNVAGSQNAWKLSGFCVAGEGPLGQRLVRNFHPLPEAAHYFDKPVDLLYDTSMGVPDMDWDHAITDRIDRYPTEFMEEHWPTGVDRLDASTMSEEDAASYWLSVGEAIKQDTRTYRRIMNRVKDAVELSVKRTAWNFKTAVPQYYPRIQRLQLLLPMCLVEDDRPDMALAVERTPSGRYLGHTMLPLDWAYRNARLVCRPDSDWLDPGSIAEQGDDEV